MITLVGGVRRTPADWLDSPTGPPVGTGPNWRSAGDGRRHAAAGHSAAAALGSDPCGAECLPVGRRAADAVVQPTALCGCSAEGSMAGRPNQFQHLGGRRAGIAGAEPLSGNVVCIRAVASKGVTPRCAAAGVGEGLRQRRRGDEAFFTQMRNFPTLRIRGPSWRARWCRPRWRGPAHTRRLSRRSEHPRPGPADEPALVSAWLYGERPAPMSRLPQSPPRTDR